jgi:membrane protease YdiL (CAAX protease family)
VIAIAVLPPDNSLFGNLTVTAFVGILLGASTEELLWRGGLEAGLWSHPHQLAICVSIFGFGLAHYRKFRYREVFFYCVIGMILSAAEFRCGTDMCVVLACDV